MDTVCLRLHRTCTTLPLIVVFAPVIVMLRVWVLWNRRTIPVVFTLVAFVLSQIVTFSMVIWAAIQMIRTFRRLGYLTRCSTG